MPPVAPVDLVALAAVVLGILVVLIPVAGLTLRFAIKPVTEALAASRQSASDQETIRLLERRVALLEQEVNGVSELRPDLERLVQDLEFQRQLKSRS